MSQTILQWVAHYGYLAIFSLLMLGIVGLPVPDEWLLSLAGFLVFKGNLQLLPTVVAAFLGSACGISLSYALGRTLGLHLVHRYGHVVHLTSEKVNRIHHWYERIGRWSLTFGYFLPGVRHVTALIAGTSKLELPVFALFAYPGALIWSASFIGLGYFVGERWARVSERVHHHLMAASLIVVALALLYWLVQQKWRRVSSDART